ncbi:MAG: hypothetical protein GX443_10250 [Deltaproteobacteria bacterium]|nr:hypothetical protein [Deltaproteobacteria bacterium]
MATEKSFAKRILDTIVQQIEAMPEEELRRALKECQLISVDRCGIAEFQIGSVIQCLIDEELGRRAATSDSEKTDTRTGGRSLPAGLHCNS